MCACVHLLRPLQVALLDAEDASPPSELLLQASGQVLSNLYYRSAARHSTARQLGPIGGDGLLHGLLNVSDGTYVCMDL